MNITLHKVGCHAPYEPYLRSPPLPPPARPLAHAQRRRRRAIPRGRGYLLSPPLLTSFSLMLAPLTRVSGNVRLKLPAFGHEKRIGFRRRLWTTDHVRNERMFVACGRGISFSKVRIVRESPSSSFPSSSSSGDESPLPLPLDRA